MVKFFRRSWRLGLTDHIPDRMATPRACGVENHDHVTRPGSAHFGRDLDLLSVESCPDRYHGNSFADHPTCKCQATQRGGPGPNSAIFPVKPRLASVR